MKRYSKESKITVYGNPYWFAIMNDKEYDDWGTGSRDIDEALQMARDQLEDYPETYIAVIDDDEDNPLCIDTIETDEIKGWED